jgi:hypothetical protein
MAVARQTVMNTCTRTHARTTHTHTHSLTHSFTLSHTHTHSHPHPHVHTPPIVFFIHRRSYATVGGGFRNDAQEEQVSSALRTRDGCLPHTSCCVALVPDPVLHGWLPWVARDLGANTWLPMLLLLTQPQLLMQQQQQLLLLLLLLRLACLTHPDAASAAFAAVVKVLYRFRRRGQHRQQLRFYSGWWKLQLCGRDVSRGFRPPRPVLLHARTCIPGGGGGGARPCRIVTCVAAQSVAASGAAGRRHVIAAEYDVAIARASVPRACFVFCLLFLQRAVCLLTNECPPHCY